jgi:hypothetical protein
MENQGRVLKVCDKHHLEVVYYSVLTGQETSNSLLSKLEIEQYIFFDSDMAMRAYTDKKSLENAKTN